MKWKDSTATWEEMAERLDEAYDMENHLGGNPNLKKKLRPPDEPKDEELPEEVAEACHDDYCVTKGMKTLCKALLSHIKSEQKEREKKIKEDFLHSAQIFMDQRDQDFKSGLDERYEEHLKVYHKPHGEK